MRRLLPAVPSFLLLGLTLLALAPAASATPVCTDGYMGGPPLSQCGGRVFPEAAGSVAYVQYSPDPRGFEEYRHGLEFLAGKYDRWVSTTTLSAVYGKDAKSAGGHEIPVFKVTDHQVADKGKRSLFFSLSIHGNERGGLEGGVRTAEDLAIAATNGGKISDGIDNYASTTGRKPTFKRHEVRDLLAQEVVYFVDVNIDGWATGDLFKVPSLPFQRGNVNGTDLNRQMPTIGSINPARTPLAEPEARAVKRLIDEKAAEGRNGLLDLGADVHGELTSQAYMDIMYPAGQFDSVDHRRLMAIAERTKSVIDATLYDGIIDEIEAADGGNEAEGTLKTPGIPTKPAHWATVWDTLGYTDTGFLGDYLATDAGVTGMDYEIFLNHTVPDRGWTVALQENHINATRGIIKTAMAYALEQDREFNADNVKVRTGGRAGYVVDPDPVTDTDADGAGVRPGPKKDGVGADGKPVTQAPYRATQMQWFADTNRLMPTPFVALASGDVERRLDLVDSLVLADVTLPRDAAGRPVDRAAYIAAIKAWVQKGGNLVLTDRALHLLDDLGVVPASSVQDFRVYQPYANFTDLTHPLLKGLRSNARQLVEAAVLGYGIGNEASPMTAVDTTTFRDAGGTVLGTTGPGAGSSDDGSMTTVGQLTMGKGQVRIIGGALPRPTEANDHRFGLRDYALTYTGLFLMENAIEHDAPGLGEGPLPTDAASPARSCLSRRTFTLTVPKRLRRGATVTVQGRRVPVRKGRARVDLRGISGAKVVRVVIRGKRGTRTISETRRYRTCVKRT